MTLMADDILEGVNLSIMKADVFPRVEQFPPAGFTYAQVCDGLLSEFQVEVTMRALRMAGVLRT
jgi:hypothetical protein